MGPIRSLEEKKAQVVADEIVKAGGHAIAVGGDVSADEFPQKIIDATIKYVPTSKYMCSLTVSSYMIRNYGKINHIVNNAGFTYDRMLHTTPDDAFDIIMKVHVRAPFRLIRAAAPYLRIKVRKLSYTYVPFFADRTHADVRTAQRTVP